ncbi:MAG TPA: ABC-2 family transporter protein [Limnochordia bacterium]
MSPRAGDDRSGGGWRLNTLVRGYRALMHIAWSNMLQYRASVFLWTLWSIAGPIIHLSVWRSITQAEGQISGYDPQTIVAYFLVQSIVYHFTSAWQVYEFSYLIRMGTLSTRLLRPFDPSHWIVTQNVAFKLINLIWLVPIWLGLGGYFRPRLEWSAGRILAFAGALLIAAALRFLWTHCWAMVSFWTVRAAGLHELIDAVNFLIGGGIAPVGLLPGILQALGAFLPFYYMLGWPIDIGAGTLSLDTVGPALLRAVGWTGALFIIYRILWWRGLRRYGAVGA